MANQVKKFKRPNHLLIAIAILSIPFTSLLPGLAAVPMLSHIATNYNSVFFSKMFLVLPSIIVLPFLLASKFLNKFFTNKQLIVYGMLLFAISGLALTTLGYRSWLIFFRSLIGVASGMVVPFTPLLVSQFFYGKKRGQILAASGLITYLFGIFVFLSLGFLIDIYWKLGFLIYLVAIIPMLLIYYFVPNTKRTMFGKITDKSQLITTNNPQDLTKSTKKFGTVIWLSLLFLIINTIIGFSYFGDLGFLINNYNKGSDIEVNLALSLIMLSGLIANLVLMFLKNFNLYTLRIVQLALICLSLFIVSLPFVNIYLVYFSAVLFGLGYGSVTTATSIIMVNYSNNVNKVNIMLFFAFFMYASQIVSPFITENLYNAIGLYSIKAKFLTSGLLLSTLLGILIYRKVLKFKRQKQTQAEADLSLPQ